MAITHEEVEARLERHRCELVDQLDALSARTNQPETITAIEALVDWVNSDKRRMVEDLSSHVVDDAVAIVEALNTLRRNEGASVCLNCDNPDFNDLPNVIIEVCDEWTGWQPQRFGGDSLVAALRKALQAREREGGPANG